MTVDDQTARWFWVRIGVVFVMGVVTLLLMLFQLLEISHNIERDGIRAELNATDHRIKHELCDIAVQNEVVRNRINERTDRRIKLCNPDEALPDLMARRDLLDARLREMGAYEVRDE